jgi:hypothetical protein
VELNQPTPPLERRRVVVRRQQLKRLENCAYRDDSRLTMKSQLLTTIAAVLVVGCGESQQSAPAPEAKPVEPVAEAATPETTTAKPPDISIYDAVREGNIEAVKRHLASSAGVNAKNAEGWTPLHEAATCGYKEVVELLIENAADVNAKTTWGGTPLHRAAIYGYKEIAEVLIAAGADVNAKYDDDGGETPLDLAIEENKKETADLLRKHGGKTGAELKAEGK